jgi:hypothetical protein
LKEETLINTEKTCIGSKRFVIRDEVAWFAKEMEEVLTDNDHKGGWSDCDIKDYLFPRLMQELKELEDVLIRNPHLYSSLDIVKECADVANFAMMIADNANNK